MESEVLCAGLHLEHNHFKRANYGVVRLNGIKFDDLHRSKECACICAGEWCKAMRAKVGFEPGQNRDAGWFWFAHFILLFLHELGICVSNIDWRRQDKPLRIFHTSRNRHSTGMRDSRGPSERPDDNHVNPNRFRIN